MTSRSPHHDRALAAAAGLVGRPRLRAGLMLTLVACGVEIEGSGALTQDPESTGVATTGSPSLTTGVAPGSTTGVTSGTGGPAETSTTTGGPATSTGGFETTGETLTTDVTTLASTGETDSGATTDIEGSSSGSTGGLSDCLDPRSGDIDWLCCEMQQWQPAPQCTPWGPPAPPAASREQLRRARAARGRLV